MSERNISELVSALEARVIYNVRQPGLTGDKIIEVYCEICDARAPDKFALVHSVTCPLGGPSFSVPQQTPAEREADFLIRRIDELEFGGDEILFHRDWMGHVEPSIARLRKLLKEEKELHSVFHAKVEEDNRYTLIERTHLACIASCTCLTKTDNFVYHDIKCRYRILVELANALVEQDLRVVELEANAKGDGWREFNRVKEYLSQLIGDHYAERSMWARLSRVKRWWENMKFLKEKAETENQKLKDSILYNECVETSIKALRFYAEHERPIGGEQRFNSLHAHQLADELESVLETVKKK